MKPAKQPVDAYVQEVGRNVYIARDLRGWSLRKLEELSGVVYSSISRFEGGTEGISIVSLRKLADAFGISPFVLMMKQSEMEALLGVENMLGPRDISTKKKAKK
jgi:transcriptional regulator with XRE-family HTH domain